MFLQEQQLQKKQAIKNSGITFSGKSFSNNLFTQKIACLLCYFLYQYFLRHPFHSHCKEYLLYLIFAFLPRQIKLFYILHKRSIVLLRSLVISKICISLETAKDLKTVILPSRVNCLM